MLLLLLVVRVCFISFHFFALFFVTVVVLIENYCCRCCCLAFFFCLLAVFCMALIRFWQNRAILSLTKWENLYIHFLSRSLCVRAPSNVFLFFFASLFYCRFDLVCAFFFSHFIVSVVLLCYYSCEVWNCQRAPPTNNDGNKKKIRYIFHTFDSFWMIAHTHTLSSRSFFPSGW